MLLSALQEDLDILEAESGREAIEQLQQNPDIELCLLDLTLRGESGLDVLPVLKRTNQKVVIVVVSGDERPTTIHSALAAGAMGYIPKTVSPVVMCHALRLILAGGIYLPKQLIEYQLQNSQDETVDSIKSFHQGLTTRQLDVLHGLSKGWSDRVICQHLKISENTLKGHLAAIYRILDVRNRTQAVIAASNLGISADLGSKTIN